MRSLAPNATARAQISEPIEPPPPVTSTRLPRMKCSSRVRSICTVGRRSRSSISSGASSASRMPSPRLVTRDSGRPRRRARAMQHVRIGLRHQRARRRHEAPDRRRRARGNPARPDRDRRRCRAPARRGSIGRDRRRGTTGCPWAAIFLTVPDSMARSDHLDVAGAPEQQGRRAGVALQGVARAGIFHVAEGEARPAEQEHLHQPVERDRDLAEEVEAEAAAARPGRSRRPAATSAGRVEARKMLNRSGRDAKRHFER